MNIKLNMIENPVQRLVILHKILSKPKLLKAQHQLHKQVLLPLLLVPQYPRPQVLILINSLTSYQALRRQPLLP